MTAKEANGFSSISPGSETVERVISLPRNQIIHSIAHDQRRIVVFRGVQVTHKTNAKTTSIVAIVRSPCTGSKGAQASFEIVPKLIGQELIADVAPGHGIYVIVLMSANPRL